MSRFAKFALLGGGDGVRVRVRENKNSKDKKLIKGTIKLVMTILNITHIFLLTPINRDCNYALCDQ